MLLGTLHRPRQSKEPLESLEVQLHQERANRSTGESLGRGSWKRRDPSHSAQLNPLPHLLFWLFLSNTSIEYTARCCISFYRLIFHIVICATLACWLTLLKLTGKQTEVVVKALVFHEISITLNLAAYMERHPQKELYHFVLNS